MQIEIKAVRGLHATPGDLSAQIEGNRHVLPIDVADALRKDGIRTAEDLLSYMMAFPSSLASALHWSLGDVGSAAERLKDELEGHVSDEQLRGERRPARVFGARNPDELG